MSAADVAALVTALDALSDLDACSRDEKIGAARKILEKAPLTLPHDLAKWIRESGRKLSAKLRTDSLSNNRRLAYVAAIVSNGPPDVAKPRAPDAEASNRADAEFARNAYAEAAELEREYFADDTRNRRVAAIEHWRRERVEPRNHGKEVPPPYWALYGFDSPDDYERRKNKPLRGMSAQEPPRTEPKATRPIDDGLPTMSDAIDDSRELQRGYEANETYAEDGE